jgi:hypothetical protein
MEGKIIVSSPKELQEKVGVIRNGIANFGTVPYGHSVFGNIYFGKSINLNLDSENAYGCKEYTNGKTERDGYAQQIIFLIKRGECQTSDKVTHIEKAGGKIAILIDSLKDGDSSRVVLSNPLHAQIHIPTVIITSVEGESLLEFYLSKSVDERKQIMLMVQFETNKRDDRVEYDIWLSSANDKGMKFIEDFYSFHSEFGDHALFQPRYFSWSCPV